MIPVVLMHIPVTLVYAFALFDKDIGMLSGLLSITIAAYPAIDPLPTLIIVPHYREALLYYLRCCHRSPIEGEEDSQVPSKKTKQTEASRSREASTTF